LGEEIFCLLVSPAKRGIGSEKGTGAFSEPIKNHHLDFAGKKF